jgi:hypothetical protein
MTDHPTHGLAHPQPVEVATAAETVTQACVHIDAAARQLETAAEGDVFSPLLALAGQLSLIRGGIDPSIRAAADPNDHLGPSTHLDRALTLLDGIPPSAGFPDQLVWAWRLSDVRDLLNSTDLGEP